MSETQSLSITAIRIDGGTQPRAVISTTTVGEYAEAIRAGTTLPPIDVFHDGVHYWLADGFHRYFAAQRLERLYVTATVHSGTKREAVLFAVGANHGHGLQRTNADKRKAVMTLLNDVEWGAWSDSEIGRRCAVNHETVGSTRKSLADSASEKKPVTYTTKHGTEATMKVGNIGRNRPERGRASGRPSNSRAAVAQRRVRMQEMAVEGYTSRQMAATLGLSEEGCRNSLRDARIDVPADRVVGQTKHHDSTRVMEHIVMDAGNLTAAVELIDFARLERARLSEWTDSLTASRKALDGLIKRLMKEQQKHEAA